MERPQYTNKPFHEALGELLAEHYADKLGRVSTGEFVGEVQETMGQDQPQLHLLPVEKRAASNN